ncbi:MAG TPA: DinB family protein [Gemmatimonadales bacterium]
MSRQQFLDAYEKEHTTTMRVLRAYPVSQLDLRPHPRCKTARELAWIFVLERGLGAMVLNGEFGKGPSGQLPPPPASWDQLLGALEKGHKDFGDLVRSLPDAKLDENVKFMTGPKQLGDVRRMDFCWFLLHDQIHHRGQFSVYLRMADGKVPSIYGPTGDEPWM